jgi:hypothetical protein
MDELKEQLEAREEAIREIGAVLYRNYLERVRLKRRLETIMAGNAELRRRMARRLVPSIDPPVTFEIVSVEEKKEAA